MPSRQQAEPTAPPGSAQPPSTTRVEGQPFAEAAPCPVAESKVRVTLTGVRFEAPGGGAVPPAIAAALARVRAPGQGDQPISVVCAVRDEADAALRSAGFVASVQIPAQQIADGRLRLVVISARLIEVHVVGDAGRFRGVIEKRAAALMKLDPLNEREAERQLLVSNDVPGLYLRLTLKPAGRVPGEVIGEIDVTTQPFLALANFQNTGSRQLGPEIWSLRGEAYGLTGLADRTYVGYSNTAEFRESHVLQVGHDMGLGTDGFRIGVRASYALSNPAIPNLDLRTTSLIAGIDLSLPFVRALNYDIRGSSGFEVLNQRTIIRQSGTETPFTRDRTRVFYAKLDGDAKVLTKNGGEFWSLTGYAQVRQGIQVFDSSRRGTPQDQFQPSRFDGDPLATVVSGEVVQTLRPVPPLAITGSLFGQWSNHALLNLEQFSLGNLTYGRGYDPGSNGGDRAIAARIEPRWRVPWRPWSKEGVTVELTGFYDWVRLYNLEPGTLENDRTLRSVGGGVRVTLPSRLQLDVTYARPLDFVLKTDTRKPPDRVLVTLTAKLWPLRTYR